MVQSCSVKKLVFQLNIVENRIPCCRCGSVMLHIIWKINTAKLCCIDLISKNFKNISALGLQSESMTFGSTLALGIWTWDRLLWYLLDFVVCLRLFRLVVCGWTPYPIDYDVSISSFGMDILSIFYSFCDVALNYCTVVGETLAVQTLAGFWIFLEIFRK